MTETQQCLQCGGPRGPERPMYCSHKCGDDAYRVRVKAASANNVTGESANNVTACQRCGGPMPRSLRKPRLYCSAACRKAASRANDAQPAPEEWIPEPGANRNSDAVQRRKLIRAWAEQGYSSRQMSGRLGMGDQAIRRIAREMSIAIPADDVIVKTHYHDSASIIRETAQALEGLVMGVSLVSFDDDIDPAEAKAWATSLSGSLRVLSQFANQVKEMTQ